MKSKKLRTIFLTGIIVITPATVTFLVIYYVFSKIDTSLSPLLLKLLSTYAPALHVPPFLVSIVSVILVVAIVFFVGLLTGNYVGNYLLRLIDKIFSKTPVVRGVYTAVKQFLDAFQLSNSQRFHKVVALEYPKADMWVIGFVTSDTNRKTSEAVLGESEKLINVFIPTTPNPTSGYLVMVEQGKLKELSMTIEEAIKYIVSAGVLQNNPTGFEQKTDKRLKL